MENSNQKFQSSSLNNIEKDSRPLNPNARSYCVIVAGGKGVRAGAEIPKQFVALAGVPMIFHTIRAFAAYDPEMKIVVVMNEDYMDLYARMCSEFGFEIPHAVVTGGASRAESVWNGLQYFSEGDREPIDENTLVAIHDAARPLVSGQLIARGFESAGEAFGAIPVVKSINSLRRLMPKKKGESLIEMASITVDRNEYVEVQTPQVFRYIDIVEAYRKAPSLNGFTDDASVAEAAGMNIRLYEGEHSNLKVTTPEDFMIAETLMKISGVGYDEGKE